MSLHILRGRFKNRRIETVTTEAVRPTTGRVRQRVFDTLSFVWPESVGVDAFAGSGMIGFEALSSGAKQVYACESSPEHAGFIQKNKTALGLTDTHYTLAIHPFDTWWKANAETLPVIDWVYLDPPYGYPAWASTIRMMLDAPCIGKGSVFIVEQGTDPKEMQAIEGLLAEEASLKIYKRIPCGDTLIWILEYGRG
jgi:16S rRNA (guanine966-N2)-methyltransferase